MFNFKKLLKVIRYNWEFNYNRKHPDKCPHYAAYGNHTKGYRTLYCNCCGLAVDYIPIRGHVGK